MARAACLLWVVGLAQPGGAAQEASPRSPVLSRAIQVRELSATEAQRNYPVRLTGVVTFADPERGLLFLHDGEYGVFVSPQTSTWDWPAGQQVEVTGVSAQGSHLPYVQQAHLRDLGSGAWPVARNVSFARLAANHEDGNWVEVRGVVRVADTEKGRSFLELSAEGKRLRVNFLDAASLPELPGELVDAEVRVQGVPGVAGGDRPDACFGDLHVPGRTNLTVESRPAVPILRAPTRTVASLRSASGTPALVHRVRVTGQLSRVGSDAWQIADASGAIRIGSTRPLYAATNTVVEMGGFPGGEAGSPALEDVTVYLPSWPQDSPQRDPTHLLPSLTEAEAVRNLPVQEARQGYPVQLRGIVTYADPGGDRLFLQDDTSGIGILDPARSYRGRAGQEVIVTGYSGAGSYAPVVREPAFEVHGAQRMPAGKNVSWDQLDRGWEDGQRVAITGVVRYGRVEQGRLHLKVGSQGGFVSVFLPPTDAAPWPTNLVDAEVRIRGVCDTVVNRDRQRVGFRLLPAGPADLIVLRPPPADPFSLPLQPLNRPFQFRSQDDLRHRVHMRGKVTFRDRQWCTLFIQDDSGSLFANALSPPEVALGDMVEVAGFVEQEPDGLAMREMLWRRSGPGSALAPTPVTIAQAVSGEFQSRLISLSARFLEPMRGASGRGLVLQEEEWGFTALLESTQDAATLASLRPGSQLRLTGICRLEAAEGQKVRKLQVHLRTPNDVIVLQHPPRWTAEHWMAAAGVLGVTMLAAAGWVVSLRRNVREQTEIIRRDLEKQAALEAEYRELFGNVNDLIQSLRPDGSIAYVNPAWLAALGYTADELGRLDLGQVVHPEDLPHCTRLVQRALAGERLDSVSLRFRGKQGQTIEVEGDFSPSRKEGGPAAIRSIFHDVTARKQAEAALLALNQQLEERVRERTAEALDLYHNAPCAYHALDAEGLVLQINDTELRWLGYSREEIVGRRRWPELMTLPSARTFHEIFPPFVKEGTALNAEWEMQRKDGSCFTLLVEAVAVRNAQGDFLRTNSTGIDISKRKQAEEAVRRADRAKSAFLANMSHEIRTPMNAILGFSQLLLRDPQLTEAQRQQLNTITRSGGHLMDIINDILEMARIESGHVSHHPTVFDLLSLLEDLEGLFAPRMQAKGLRFVTELLQPIPRYIRTDESKLRQILINLLGNAVKFTPGGGHIRLRVQAFPEPDGRLRLRAEVEDSGIGIAAEDLPRLFEAFFQAGAGQHNAGGTGLGLAISREFVRLLGGELTVRSQPGVGSAFQFDIRVSPAASDARAPESASGPQALHLLPGLAALRVLIVDDQEENCELLERLLGPVGFETRTAREGTQALALAIEWRPHVVLMDLRMPGMDGYETTRRLRAAHGVSLKILALSAGAFPVDRQLAAEAGVDDFLVKPFHDSELLQRIKQLTGCDYVYDTRVAASHSNLNVSTPELPTPEEIAQLPVRWVEALREATRRAEYDQMLELVDEIAAANARVGESLRCLVKKFDYDTLQELLSGKSRPGRAS